MIADYTPSVQDLAALIPARASGRFTGGAGAPTFPDTDRVQVVIEDATGLIAPSLGGDDLDRRFWNGAKALIKFQAAVILEPSAWPEQARPDKTAFSEWQGMVDTAMSNLTKAVTSFRREEGDGGPLQEVMPSASFPPAPYDGQGVEGAERPCWDLPTCL